MSQSRYIINPRVLVGVPTLEKHPLSWQWMDAYQSIDFPLGSSAIRYRTYGKKIDEARNDIVERALAENADYVFFLADDVLPPSNAFKLLHRHHEHMVTGMYWTKCHPTQPYIFDGLLNGPYEDWRYGEYFPVDWAGVDCLLIHTDVFKAISPPWFSCDWQYQDAGMVYHPTEDAYFYTKAREAGFQLFCDSEVQCEHQDRGTGLTFGLRPEMTRYFSGVKVLGDERSVLVADIGSGADTPWFGSKAIVRRFDAAGDFAPDMRCDIRAIPAPDDTFDIVHARHVLEHFAPFEAVEVVREWLRILKPGGRMILNVPNLGFAARRILEAEQGAEVGVYPLWQLFGQQMGNYGEVHKNGFTVRSVESLMAAAGLGQVAVKTVGDGEVNIEGVGVKVAPNATPLVLQPVWQEAEKREKVRGHKDRKK